MFATPDERAEGTLVDFSDSGAKRNYFAVIDVIRRRTVVVPLEKVERVIAQNNEVLDQDHLRG